MEEYLSQRSKTPIGFLRRGSGISWRNRSPEERTNHNKDGLGGTTRLNHMKTRLSDSQEKSRYIRDSFKSSGSNGMPGSSSKALLRKFGEEKRRQPLLAGVDIAESSRSKAEAKHLEGNKNITEEDESSDTLQTDIEGTGTEEGQLVALPTSPSNIPAHESLVKGVLVSSKTHGLKDKEFNYGRQGACSSSFTNQPAIPRIPTIGAKPSQGLFNGIQRRGPKNLDCNTAPDILPSACSSDSGHNRRIDAMRKRASDEGSTSRSRGTSRSSSLGHSPTMYPGISGPRMRTSEQSVSRQTIRKNRNIHDSAMSVRTRRPSSQHTGFRMSEEREGAMLSLHEDTTGNQQSDRAHYSVEVVSSGSFMELPNAIYPSGSQVSNTRTTRRRSSSRFEVSPPQTFCSLLGERNGLRRITMEGIAEVLLALDRIEQGAELTYELLVLETNILLGAFASHDQHSAMRMDIDNMSYEELLALEERIGSVSTALSEEQFVKCLRRSVYRPAAAEANRSAVDDIKCSICQEEYMEGEEVGRLGCEHQYHVCCIHQWLRQKNWCPICKASAAPSLKQT